MHKNLLQFPTEINTEVEYQQRINPFHANYNCKSKLLIN